MSADTVRVPGPRVAPPNLPHVLVITDPGDGLEKEWEVQHPDGCPVSCPWWPVDDPVFPPFDRPDRNPVEHRSCLVAYELDAIGLDSLAVVSHRERGPDGEWRDVCDACVDPDYVPGGPFEAEWHRLRPGRYLIEGWYHDGRGMGDYGGQGDADGGLTLLGIAP